MTSSRSSNSTLRTDATKLLVSLLGLATLWLILLPTASAAAQAGGGAVVINELSPRNTEVADEDGDSSDWIELENTSSSPINLDGWILADDSESWTIESLTLSSGGRALFFASDKDRPTGERHTNFKLSGGGETLTLLDAAGNVADSMTYPPLDQDQTWGRGSTGGIGSLESSTPNNANTRVQPLPVVFDPPSGTAFTGSITVSLSNGEGHQIRYTTNGTRPTAQSTLYNGPIAVTKTTHIRAIAVNAGALGNESLGVFSEVDASIASFTSDLPIVVLETGGQALTSPDVKVDVAFSVFDVGPNGRAAFDTAEHNAAVVADVRGASSAAFAKRQYKINIVDNWSDDGSRDVDLLGMGAESDWVLYAPGRFDRQRIQNPFMHTLYDQMGLISSDFRFVEVYLDDNNDGKYSSAEYDGIYILMESIKVSEERVDITKIDATDNAGDDVTGGYIFAMDWNDDCCQNISQTPAGSYLTVKTPKSDKLTTAQRTYTADYMTEVQQSLGRSFTDSNGPQAYLDIDSFIDDHILQVLSKQTDTFRASNYFYKDRNGLLINGPAWDYDRSLNSADSRDDTCNSFTGLALNPFTWHWWGDLWSEPEYQALFKMEWQRARAAELSDTSLVALSDSLGAEISEAWPREQARWGSTSGYQQRYGSLTGEINAMNNWLTCRTAYMDSQFISTSGAPTLGNAGALNTTELSAAARTITANDPQNNVVVFRAEGLPLGLTIDRLTGQVNGTPLLGTAGSYAATIIAVDSTGASQTANLTVNVAPTGPAAAAMLLNEYNAVSANKSLAAGGVDTQVGQVPGNGGDWLELVTVQDNLDIRGWTIELLELDDVEGTVTFRDSFTLTNANVFSDLRAGTLITISEDFPDDVSYDPLNGDWDLMLQSSDSQDGGYITGITQQNFNTDENGFMVVIRDASGNVVGPVAGETETWDNANGGVSDSEVFSLCVEPAAVVDEANDYVDHNRSTLSAPNQCPGGFTQSMSIRPAINTPPVLTLPGDLTNPIQVAWSIPITATDVEGGPLTYTVTGLPSGLTFNPNTNTITGTATSLGVATVTVTVEDPFGETDSDSLTVTTTNASPVFTAPQNQTNPIQTPYNIALTATDAQGDPLTYTVTGLPSGLTFNPNTNTITGTATSVGVATVTVTVEDPYGASDTGNFTVNTTNASPVFTAPQNQTNPIQTPFSILLPATDPQGDPLTLTVTGLPSGLTFNPNTNTITGTAAAPAVTTVTVVAADPFGASDTGSFTITATNDAPVITAPGDQNTASQTPLTLPITVSDPNNHTVTTSVLGLPPGLTFQAGTNTVSGTITSSGSWDVTITATDPFNMTSSESFTWSANSGPSVNNPGSRIAERGDAASLVVSGSDPDGDALTWSATGLPGGLSINPVTGLISGVHDLSGSFNVTVIATDGDSSSSASFTWRVNSAPIIVSPGNQATTIGETTTLAIEASDIDNNALSYAATSLPSGFSINAVTGIISGTATAAAAGNTTVTVAVTDSFNKTDSTTFGWYINTPPTITFGTAATAVAGSPTNVTLTATDPDPNTLSWSATGLPAGLLLNNATGSITGSPDQPGSVVSTIFVDDNSGGSASVEVLWTITADNSSAQISTSCLGTNGRVDVTFNNPNASSTIFSVNFPNLPTRAITVAGGGTGTTTFTGRPDGNYNVTVTTNTTSTTEAVAITCDPVSAVSWTCLSGNGLVAVELTNAFTDTGTFSVTIDAFTKTTTIDPFGTETLRVSGRDDGDTPIRIERNGTELEVTSVFVDCDPDIEVAFSQTCLAGNGRFDFVLTNPTAATVTYSVNVEGLNPRLHTVAPGEATRVSVTGRPDNTYDLAIERDGTSIWAQSATVDCDPDVELTITVGCLSGNGRIDVHIRNTTAAAADYTVIFGSFAPRSTGSLAPGVAQTITTTGRPDGGLAVTVTRNGSTISTTPYTIACD